MLIGSRANFAFHRRSGRGLQSEREAERKERAGQRNEQEKEKEGEGGTRMKREDEPRADLPPPPDSSTKFR